MTNSATIKVWRRQVCLFVRRFFWFSGAIQECRNIKCSTNTSISCGFHVYLIFKRLQFQAFPFLARVFLGFLYFTRKVSLLLVTKMLTTPAFHILLNSSFTVMHLVLGVKFFKSAAWELYRNVGCTTVYMHMFNYKTYKLTVHSHV
jgi:hypothetical protein